MALCMEFDSVKDKLIEKEIILNEKIIEVRLLK
jgi:hypothetical protein